MKALLVSFSLSIPYRVLRCGAAAGLQMFVLGNRKARGLARSRFCTGFIEMAEAADNPAAEITRHCRRLGCSMVLPSDHQSFRLLSLLKQDIGVPLFPLPDIEPFDLLNQKDNFARHCAAVAVPCPRTATVDSVAAIKAALAVGQYRLPLVLKPLAADGGAGVAILRSPADLGKLERIAYRPILVQEYIEGKDVDATVFARGGRVITAQTYYRDGWRLVFDRNERLIEQSVRVIEALGVDGVFNFDARIAAATGTIYMIECNPRFFFSMDYAALAGINFVELGLRPAAAIEATGREATFWPPIVTLKRFAALRRPNRDDWRALCHFLRDPMLPLIYEEIPWRFKRAKPAP